MTDRRVLGIPVHVRNARVASRGGASLRELDIPPDTLIDLPLGEVSFDVSTAAARRRAGWAILRRTAKPTDGWVSRHLNRPLSCAVSYVLLTMGLRADHASLVTLGVGLAAAVAAAQPGYGALVVTGVLFHLASVLDGVDGEMARATLTESASGARLDTIVDQLTYAACFVGQTIGWAREGSGRAAITWTAAIGIALAISLARGGRFVARHARDASFVAIDRAVRRAARDTGRLSLRAAAAAFTLLRRDLFAVIFLFICLTGQRALIPMLIAFGIVIANVTFSTHHRELADAAAADRLSTTPGIAGRQ
jgi:CDP-L-myo-inositol myo-inositolphosphotransferase